MKEQALIDQIKAYLNHYPQLFYWKEHGGIYGTAGIPDIIICYKGRFIALECTSKNKKPTVLQQVIINKINKAGGVAVVVYSLDEVKELIKKLS
jgi:hypothetical protein